VRPNAPIILRAVTKIAMLYDIYFLDEAKLALKRLSPEVSGRIVRKIARMRQDLAGDVKRLKAFIPNYRLRVGDWRVLFEVEDNTIIVHEIKHRSQAYDG
jgi:mRNA interferase RelE/StbE